MQPDHGKEYIHELDRNTWCNISNPDSKQKVLENHLLFVWWFDSSKCKLISIGISQCVKIVVDPLPTFTQTWIILLKCLYAYEKKKNLKKTFTQTYMYHYHTSNKRPWINFLKISIKSLDSYALIELSLRISNFNMIHSRCFLYSQINEFVESRRVIHVYLSSSLLM